MSEKPIQMTNILTNEMVKVEPRLVISISYVDSEGQSITKSSGMSKACKTSVLIKYDIITIVKGENFDDKKAFGSGDKLEHSAYGEDSSEEYYVKFSLKDFSKLKSVIYENLKQKTDILELSVIGLTQETIFDEELITFFFKKYSIINLDFGGQNGPTACIPYAEFKCESLSINGGSIIINEHGCKFETDTEISISSCIIQTTVNDPVKIMCVSKNVNVYNISITKPVTLIFSYTDREKMDEYLDSNVSMNLVKYILPQFNEDKDPNSLTGVFENPLIWISGYNSVNVSSVEIHGANNYKGLRINDCNTLNVVGFTRDVSDEDESPLNGYGIGIGNINNVNIYDISYSQNYRVDENRFSYAVFIDVEKFTETQEIVISNFELNNAFLCNTDNLRCNRISLRDGMCNGGNLITSDADSMCEIDIRNSKIYIDRTFDLYGDNITISDTNITTQSEDKTYGFNITATGKLSILGCNIILQKSDISITSEIGSSILIKESDIAAVNFSVDFPEITDETQSAMVDETKRKFKFDNSTIVCGKNIGITKPYSTTISGVSFTAKELAISDTRCNINSASSFTCENRQFLITFTNCTFNANSNIKYLETPKSNKIVFDGCSGSISAMLSYNSDLKEADTDLNVEISNSPKILFIGDVEASNGSMKVQVNDSLGSRIYSNHSNLVIVPDMNSKDIQSFEKVSVNSARNSEKVRYGVSETAVSIESYLGF